MLSAVPAPPSVEITRVVPRQSSRSRSTPPDHDNVTCNVPLVVVVNAYARQGCMSCAATLAHGTSPVLKTSLNVSVNVCGDGEAVGVGLGRGVGLGTGVGLGNVG